VKQTVNWARTIPGPVAPVPDATVRRLSRAVERTLGPLPTDSRCLVRAVVLLRLLARRGRRGEVVIGVRKAGSFGAHAWVEVDGRPIVLGETDGFERLAAF
jgi:transglutaminase superfamily protein